MADEKTTAQQKKTTATKSSTQAKAIPTDIIDRLFVESENLQKTETEIDHNLTILNTEAFQLFPQTSYGRINGRWFETPIVDLTQPPPPEPDNESIVVYANGCYLKFPFQVADLRVIEQKTVGYLPNEIAHINNTQPGEKQEKTTRRLKRIETFESFISEDEISRETDTQSTEKFSLEKSAAEVQSEENSINVNASVSGTYGVVTASLDAGFSHSEASQSSNSSSQSYAKEVVQKVIDKVSHKVKSERSIKSIEEFEETVTHIIDNTGGQTGTGDKGPKSYVYRWLTKLVRATLKNYGKRLIFQIDVAHPSNYYLSRLLKEGPKLDIPPDPLLWKRDSSNKLIRDFFIKYPSFPHSFSTSKITIGNYLAWAELYKAKLDMPPVEKVIISHNISSTTSAVECKLLPITKGYKCKKAIIIGTYGYTHGGDQFRIIVGQRGYAYYNGMDDLYVPKIVLLNDETEFLPISIFAGPKGIITNIEVECELTDERRMEWQISCYHTILEAYENLKAEAESKMSEFNPNNPGMNPTQKTEIIKTELKKGTLQKMSRCNPFWIKDTYQVGNEYNPDCCKDNENAEKVRFLETVFDWKNMTYELYPYFYTNHNKLDPKLDNWSKLLNLTDDDPHFEAFLQSSYATVRIPVHRDSEKEIAAINFILNNSIANHSVIPDNIQHVLNDLDTNTPFGYILDNPTTVDFKEIKTEYDKYRIPKIFYIDELGAEIICTAVEEYDKEGNKTIFYYNSSNQVVISEIKEGNMDGQRYSYYFNANNEKVICHKTKTEYDIEGNAASLYTTDLGVFPIPTDLVILEAGIQEGVELRGYPEDIADPTSDVIIPKQYSPAIIQKT